MKNKIKLIGIIALIAIIGLSMSCGGGPGACTHTPGAAATCTTAQICTQTGCGEVIVAALGHQWDNAAGIEKEAACTTGAGKVRSCTRQNCGHSENVGAAGEPLGHQKAAVPFTTTPATCTGNN